MRKRTKLILGVFLALGLEIPITAWTWDAEATASTGGLSSDEIVSRLRAAPCWTLLPVEDTKGRRTLTELYWKLASSDTATLRAAFIRFMELTTASWGDVLCDDSRLFAFSRVVFRIPERGYLKYRYGNPVRTDQSLDSLWPFSADEEGGLRLTGIPLNFSSGLRYPALEDFDFLLAKYGRRAAPNAAVTGSEQ